MSMAFPQLPAKLSSRRAKITGLIILVVLLITGFVVEALYQLPLPFHSKDKPDTVAAEATNQPIGIGVQGQTSATAAQPSIVLPLSRPATPATPVLSPQNVPASIVDVCPSLQQSSNQIYQTALAQTQAVFDNQVSSLLPDLLSHTANTPAVNNVIAQYNNDVDNLYKYYLVSLTSGHCMPVYPPPAHKTLVP